MRVYLPCPCTIMEMKSILEEALEQQISVEDIRDFIPEIQAEVPVQELLASGYHWPASAQKRWIDIAEGA